MIPRGLLPGTPIAFDDVQVGDVIDTYDPEMEERSRYHRRFGQTVTSAGYSCDFQTDYDMVCQHFGLWIQLRHRASKIHNGRKPR